MRIENKLIQILANLMDVSETLTIDTSSLAVSYLKVYSNFNAELMTKNDSWIQFRSSFCNYIQHFPNCLNEIFFIKVIF